MPVAAVGGEPSGVVAYGDYRGSYQQGIGWGGQADEGVGLSLIGVELG